MMSTAMNIDDLTSMSGLMPLLTPGSDAFTVIAGPCSAETRDQVMETARALAGLGVKYFRAGVWKPRTHPGGFEGVGEKALEWLRAVKEETGMRVGTEVATPRHLLDAVAARLDFVWIGARTSANPFAVQELADALACLEAPVKEKLVVLVKNPVNPDLELWIGALQRIYIAGIKRLGAIHRGFSQYGEHIYRNDPGWKIPIELHRRYPSLPIIFDPSHIAGKSEYVETLSRQAVDMDFDGLIVEVHPSPSCALSDSRQQITPAMLASILESLHRREETAGTDGRLGVLRDQIDCIDRELIDVLSRRMDVAREIGSYKKQHNLPVVQPDRYGNLMQQLVKVATEMGLKEDFVKELMSLVHEESVKQQLEITTSK